MWWIIAICLIGIYKSWKGYLGCIKSSALKPAFDMLLITLLFIVILVIELYTNSHNI